MELTYQVLDANPETTARVNQLLKQTMGAFPKVCHSVVNARTSHYLIVLNKDAMVGAVGFRVNEATKMGFISKVMVHPFWREEGELFETMMREVKQIFTGWSCKAVALDANLKCLPTTAHVSLYGGELPATYLLG